MTAVPGVLPFLFSAFLVAQPAADETPVYRLPPVVVDAPRVAPTPLFPGARSVFDRAWLERRDPADLAEALTAAAGLRVHSLGDGSGRAVSIRGLGADRTAVLVDGHLRNTAQGGGVDLGSMNLAGVERIEVARGAMGAFYGPYALGGAVNVVTRRNRETSTTVGLRAGTQERTELELRGDWSHDRLSAGAGVELHRLAPDLGGAVAESETRSGSIRFALHPRWASALELSLEGRRDARDVPGSRAFPTPEARRRDDLAEASLTLQGLALPGAWGGLDASLSGFRFDRHFTDPGYALGALDDLHRNRRASATLDWRADRPGLTTSVRLEAVRDRLRSTTDGEHTRDRAAVAGVGEVSRGAWLASAAARLDGLEGFSPQPTLRAGLARTIWGRRGGPTSATLRAGVGTAFRPPSFDDLFWPARATAAGNPDLRPERSWDADLGVEIDAAGSRLRFSAYRARVDDLIQWVPGPDGAWRPHNLAAAELSGVEVEGTLRRATSRGDLFLDAALGRSRAVDAGSDRWTGGKQLVGRAEWIGSGALSWHPGPLGFSWGVRGVDRVPLTAANTKWAAGYVLWDASVSWRARSGLRFEVEGRNLFDTDYEDLRGYATPGRELLISIRLQAATGKP